MSRRKPAIDAPPDEAAAFVRGRRSPAKGRKPSGDLGAAKAKAVEQRAREALKKAPKLVRLETIALRLPPQTVERVRLLSALRKRHGQPNAKIQEVVEEALANFLPAALAELVDYD